MAASRKLPDLDQVLIWDDKDTTLAQFDALAKEKPLRSVVIELHPAGAEALQKHFKGDKNRQLQRHNAESLAAAIESGQFDFSGDTIKVSGGGALLDGQHRIDAVVQAKRPMKSHWVFGLTPRIFDILDQGKGRNAADVMHIGGIGESALIAAATRWALRLQNRSGKGGLFGNVLRIKPPMCLTKDDADFLVDCLDEVLNTVEIATPVG